MCKRYTLFAVLAAVAFVVAGCADSATSLKTDTTALTPTVESQLPAEENVAPPEEPAAPKIYQLKSITTNYLGNDDEDEGEVVDSYSTTLAFSYEEGKLTAIIGTTTSDDEEIEDDGDEVTYKQEFGYDDKGRLTSINDQLVHLVAAKVDFNFYAAPQLSAPREFTYTEDRLSKVTAKNYYYTPPPNDLKNTVSFYEKEQKIKQYRGSIKNKSFGAVQDDFQIKFNDVGLVTELTTKATNIKKTYTYDTNNMLTGQKVYIYKPGFPKDESNLIGSITMKINYKDGLSSYVTYEMHGESGYQLFSTKDFCFVTEAAERNDAGLIKKEKISGGKASCKGWKEDKVNIKPIVERTFDWGDPVQSEAIAPDLMAIFENVNSFSLVDVFYALHPLLYVEQPKKILSANWPNL